MSVLTKKELLDKLKAKFGDDTSDDVLELIEDTSDTLDDFETKTKSETDWETKYKQNDDAWRKKYRDRFFNSAPDDEEPPVETETKQVKSYDDLFTTKED